ncbi:hypothetical protein VZT92_014478 [Zoarces viviparus]|uniref:Uncharacterized protein n=1 Tax=Zoarces viviparus TaxID=48416 RepID=A0AAW1F007_ZOAVI
MDQVNVTSEWTFCYLAAQIKSSIFPHYKLNLTSNSPLSCFVLPCMFPPIISGGVGVGATQKERVKGKDETYWREINAAMALTNLAQGKDGASGTTSCIIQKSSHIAEIKTVKVPLMHKY